MNADVIALSAELRDSLATPDPVPELPAAWLALQRGEGLWAEDVSEQAYHAIPIASRSRLEVLRESPALYWARFLAPLPERLLDEDTRALRVGRHFHCAVLEPGRWEDGFIGEPSWETDGRTREGKAERAAWRTENAGRAIVKADEYALAMRMRDVIWRRRTPTAARAYDMLVAADAVEQVAIWRDKVTGVLCRARIDAITYGRFIADLKSADDVTAEAFGHAAGRRGYHRQAAMYIDAVAAVTGDVLRFADIAVEKSGTHRVAIFEPDEYAIEAGRRQYRDLLIDLDRRTAANDWLDDIESGPQLLSLPGRFLEGF